MQTMYQVLIRIVGTDDAMQTYHEDTMNWLADTNLLDMLVDKLSPPVRNCDLGIYTLMANIIDEFRVSYRTHRKYMQMQLASFQLFRGYPSQN